MSIVNGKFPQAPPAGGVLVGQPFTPEAIAVPVNVTLRCNCGGVETRVVITMSAAAACPSCQKVYNAIFNPLTGQVQFSIGLPSAEQVTS